MAKERIAVLFGGVSSEHEVSCVSAAAVVENIPQSRYEVLKIGITKKGRWLLYPGDTSRMRDGTWHDFEDNVPASISPDRTNRGIVANHEGTLDVIKVAAVFPVLHGRNGEDGTVQGLLELAGIPYVGCNVSSSAICMNKAIANQIFNENGISHTPWVSALREELNDFDALQARVEAALTYPIVVKPAIGGSSVGVSKAKNADELREAAMLAGTHDATLLFEEEVKGREVECAVLGNKELLCTLPGEIVSCNEIYDYEAKYQSGDASQLHLPARLSQQKLEEVRDLALKAFRACGCTGLARVDFFVEEATGRVLLSEVNTMPGFTPISMYPKLMAQNGYTFSALVQRLIELAFERAEG